MNADETTDTPAVEGGEEVQDVQLQVADAEPDAEAVNLGSGAHTPTATDHVQVTPEAVPTEPNPAETVVADPDQEPRTTTAPGEKGDVEEKVAAMQQEGRSVALQLSEATHFLLTSMDYVSKRLQGVEKKVDDIGTGNVRFQTRKHDEGEEGEQVVEVVPETAFCVPRPRNPEFLGHVETFKAILGMWKKGQKGRIGAVGLGGIGKTEAVLEFVYHLKDLSPLTPIYWFGPEDLITKEGKESNAPAGTQLDEWLKAEYSPGCFLVVDTGDSFQDLHPIIPQLQNFSGTILLVGRSAYDAQMVVGLHEIYEFPELEVEPVMQIFNIRLDSFPRNTATEPQIRELCGMLKNNPRAMKQIVPTINRTGMKVSQFIDLYKKNDDSKLRMFGAVPPLVAAPSPQLDIFGKGYIDIEGFRASFPDGPAKMLYQLYFLGGKDVPKSMFSGVDVLEMIITLHMLTQHFLIIEDVQNQTLTLRPLVYLAMHKLIKGQNLAVSSPQVIEQRQWHEDTILLFSKRYPDAKVESRAWWKDTFSHLIAHYDLNTENLKVAAATIYNRETAFFKRRGMYHEALKMAALARSVLPDPVPANMYHVLQSQAALLEKFARYNEFAELLSKFDVEDGSVGWIWKKRMLARMDMHNCVSNYESSLTLFKELNLPPLRQIKYDSSLASEDLASVLMARGRYKEAEVEARRALTERSTTLGAGNASTLATCHNLAEILLLGGKLDQALTYASTAVLGREKVLGHYHPDTELSRAVKGRILVSKAITLADYAEAETMISSAMGKLSTALGAKHPVVWRCRSDIARINFLRGNYNAAEDIYNAVLTARSHGPWTNPATHPETLSTRHDLATLLYHRDGPKAAAAISEEILTLRKETLNDGHPEVLDSLQLHAMVLSGTGQHEDAVETITSVHQQRQSLLGDAHPDTLLSLSWKGEIMRVSQSPQTSEYITLTSQSFLQLNLMLGSEHQSTLLAATHFSLAAFKGGDCCSAATEHFGRNWGAYKRALGAKHPETCKAQARFGEALWAEGRSEEAKRHWREGCSGLVCWGGADGYSAVGFFKEFERCLEGEEDEKSKEC